VGEGFTVSADDGTAFEWRLGDQSLGIRPWRNIDRRKSAPDPRRQCPLVGGDAPIAVQTMTNTPTEDAGATIAQIRRRKPGPISCASRARRRNRPAAEGDLRESPVPVVADIHFHYKRGIEAAEAGAACLRINPGNIGSEARVKEVVQAARDHGCSMRIGVNAGSLEKHLLEKYGEPCPDAMVESALDHARILQDNGFHEYKISGEGVRCVHDGRGLSAAGRGHRRAAAPRHHRGGRPAHRHGQIAIGMGSLLWAGIGDTIRVSLSADPVEESRSATRS
jgi:(E)-4-hydroxy-3-methylbut-2-enyl-diphosphate synthase